MKTQLDRLCAKLGIHVEAKYGGSVPPSWPVGTHPYKVKLTIRHRDQRRSLTTTFYQGPACKNEPTAAGVLYCICSDARAGDLSFEEFCSDLGYDSDSREADRVWRACRSVSPRVRRFLGEAFDDVANAEH